MTNKKRTKKTNQDAVPTLEESHIEQEEQLQSWSPSDSVQRYVVIRGGLRVSDKEYSSPDDLTAVSEKNFWQKIVDSWPDGTKIEIVQFDKKKHRVW